MKYTELAKLASDKANSLSRYLCWLGIPHESDAYDGQTRISVPSGMFREARQYYETWKKGLDWSCNKAGLDLFRRPRLT